MSTDDRTGAARRRPGKPPRSGDTASGVPPDGAALRGAARRLSGVLREVAATADASVGCRCPHRGVRSRCHYPATCGNQVRVGDGTVCGGDALVWFVPVAGTSPLATAEGAASSPPGTGDR